MDDLKSLMKYYAAGETVNITLQAPEANGYAEKTVEVTLGRASEHTRTAGGYDPFGNH